MAARTRSVIAGEQDPLGPKHREGSGEKLIELGVIAPDETLPGGYVQVGGGMTDGHFDGLVSPKGEPGVAQDEA